MIMTQEKYIQISHSVLNILLKECNDREMALYMMLLKDCKNRVYGLHKHCTFSTLVRDFYELTKIDFNITQFKRSFLKLEKLRILKVLMDKKELIITLDMAVELEHIKTALKIDIKSFNVSTARMSELDKNLYPTIENS